MRAPAAGAHLWRRDIRDDEASGRAMRGITSGQPLDHAAPRYRACRSRSCWPLRRRKQAHHSRMERARGRGVLSSKQIDYIFPARRGRGCPRVAPAPHGCASSRPAVEPRRASARLSRHRPCPAAAPLSRSARRRRRRWGVSGSSARRGKLRNDVVCPSRGRGAGLPCALSTRAGAPLVGCGSPGVSRDFGLGRRARWRQDAEARGCRARLHPHAAVDAREGDGTRRGCPALRGGWSRLEAAVSALRRGRRRLNAPLQGPAPLAPAQGSPQTRQ